MSVPFGAPLFTVFLTLVALVFVQVMWREKASPYLGWVTGLGFLAALVKSVEGFFIVRTLPSSIFEATVFSKLSVSIVLLFFLVGHVFTLLAGEKLRFNFLASQVIAAFLAVALLLSESLFFYPIFFSFFFVLISAIPLNYQYDAGRGSLKRGLVYGMTFLILFAGVITTFNLFFGSMNASELVASRPEAAPSRLLYFAVGIFSFLTLFFLPPFDLFDAAYEKGNSWIAFMVFRLLCPLLGSLLIMKWAFIGGGRLPVYFAGEEGPYFEKGLMFILFGFGFWILLVGFKSRKFRDLLTALLYSPLFFGMLGLARGDVDALVLAGLSLITYILAAVFLCGLFHLSRIPLGAHVEDFKYIRFVFFPRRHIFFVVLALLIPLGNQIYFAVMQKVVLTWHLSGTASVAFLLFLILIAALSAVLFFHARDLFRVEVDGRVEEPSMALRAWNYILLIPLIFLGIHPDPLYKYIKQILSTQL